MKTEILAGPNGLTNKYPRLGKAVDTTQERRHENEALHMCHLRVCVANVLQYQSSIAVIKNKGQ